ncbi:negative regulation of centriole-centriole cohesion [Trebouxia sp. C0009 RCD-2024]
MRALAMESFTAENTAKLAGMRDKEVLQKYGALLMQANSPNVQNSHLPAHLKQELLMKLEPRVKCHNQALSSQIQHLEAAKLASEQKLSSLNTAKEDLQQQLHASTEQISSLASELNAKTASYDDLRLEHQNSVNECLLLSSSLHQSKAQVQSMTVELEEAVTAVQSERSMKDALSAEVEHKALQIAELQASLATADEVAAQAQEKHTACIAALDAELASSKQETLSAKAEAEKAERLTNKTAQDASSAEAEQKAVRMTELQASLATAGEAAAQAQEKHAASIAALDAELASSKQETLSAQAEAADAKSATEKTAQEFDDFRIKSKRETQKDRIKILALEATNKDLEAKLVHEHQQHEAAAARNQELSAQIQAVTEECDNKCRCAINEADQKISVLQAAHAQELADLKAKQQLEIKQAEHSSCKHQAATAALKKELNHLKHKLAAKHSQDKEPVLISAQVSNNADVQESATLGVNSDSAFQRKLAKAVLMWEHHRLRSTLKAWNLQTTRHSNMLQKRLAEAVPLRNCLSLQSASYGSEKAAAATGDYQHQVASNPPKAPHRNVKQTDSTHQFETKEPQTPTCHASLGLQLHPTSALSPPCGQQRSQGLPPGLVDKALRQASPGLPPSSCPQQAFPQLSTGRGRPQQAFPAELTSGQATCMWFDRIAQIRYAHLHPERKRGLKWLWEPSHMTPAVRVLQDARLSLLGHGAFHGEVLLADGETMRACAIKVVPYDCPKAVAQAQQELMALRAALGIPGLVQGIGAIEHTSPHNQPCLCILTEYAMGLSIQQALETVQEQLAYGESLKSGSITLILEIMQQLLQAVAALHDMGMAHGGIREEEVLVLMRSNNTVERCTLLDLGTSAPCYGVGSTGCRMASRLGIGPHLLSGGFPGSSENKEESYAAQDVSSLGWLLANMLTSQDLAGFPEMPGTARACLEAELSSYFEGMHTDASLGAAAAALVRSMMHPIVEERATAHQALQALQLIITASQTAEMTKLHAAATELGSQSPKATTLVGLSPGMWVKSGGLVSPSPQQKQPSISLQSAYHQPAVSLISTHGLSTQVSPKAVQNSGQGQGDVSPHQGNKQGQRTVDPDKKRQGKGRGAEGDRSVFCAALLEVKSQARKPRASIAASSLTSVTEARLGDSLQITPATASRAKHVHQNPPDVQNSGQRQGSVFSRLGTKDRQGDLCCIVKAAEIR